ncbi:hypothetical protein PG987_011475 [Apiospora arundinis]
MGIFSFLSRKASHDQRELALLKAQPYNATVAALPPIRGAYPVAGNGPNILESLQKTQRPLAKVEEPFLDSFSPAPIVPRIRDENSERPRTAPNQESRGRLDSFRGMSGSFRHEPPARTLESPAKGPPYRLPQKNTEEGHPKPPYRLPSKEHEQHVFTKPPPLFHERSASIRSGDSGMTRGFVDLLDAQSTISPINFHQRLQAAGGKIYGEDVADRNIRENGFNLDNPVIRAFYEAPSRPGPLPSSASTKGSDADLRARAKKRHSIGATLRTKSFTSSDVGSFPERTSSVIPSIPPNIAPRKQRRARSLKQIRHQGGSLCQAILCHPPRPLDLDLVRPYQSSIQETQMPAASHRSFRTESATATRRITGSLGGSVWFTLKLLMEVDRSRYTRQGEIRLPIILYQFLGNRHPKGLVYSASNRRCNETHLTYHNLDFIILYWSPAVQNATWEVPLISMTPPRTPLRSCRRSVHLA